MKVLDLFSGIGGFSLAAHWAGWETLAFVEREPFCQKVLAKNFPNTPIYDDIFDFSAVPFRHSADIITGGTPCQPFSQAGNRKGRNDERHLWPEMLRTIHACRPRWVVAENVRGLLTIESGAVFSEIAASLENAGYAVSTFCLPASAVEAPHRRDRLWIIAHCDDAGNRTQGHSVDAHGAPQIARFGQLAQLEPGGHHQAGAAPADIDAKRLPQPEYVTRENGPVSDAVQRTFAASPHRGHAGWGAHWFETAAILCRMDDGLPDGLDITGSRDNRAARIKALGNAIVPQVAFQIFAAINEVENTQKGTQK